MSKFLVLYRMPIDGLDEWMKIPAEERKAAEDQLKAKWDTWQAANASMILETAGAGKTKRIDNNGTTDTKNDLMLYSLVEAESHDAAAKLFEGHPHLEIPGAWIEVMTANPLPGMQ